MTFSKRVLYPLALFATLALVVGVARVIAAPPGSVYTPGETLAPSCSPGDTNCTVTAPMAYVAPSTSGNVLTSNGSAWTSAAPAGGSASVSSVTISGASSTITTGGTVILLDNTMEGFVTLTSTPTIAAGTNGQQILVMNLGANAVELQDDSVLPGSTLHFPAGGTISLAIGDSIPFVYLTSAGGWYLAASRANY